MRLRVILAASAALLALVSVRAALPAAEIDRIRQLQRDNKLSDAVAAATQLAATYPQEAEAHALLGTMLMSQDQPEPAVKAYERAVELDASNSELRRRLGDAYGFSAQKAGLFSKLGWAKKCLAAYQKAVELDPKNIRAHESLLGFYQQAPSVVGGGMDKAYAQAEEIKKLDGDRGRLAYAQLYVSEKKFTEAFTLFEEVLANQPENYNALYQIGRLAAASGERIDRGIEALRKALTLSPATGAPPHEAAHWRLGMLLEKKGDKTAARENYEAALKLNPQFQQASDALKKLG